MEARCVFLLMCINLFEEKYISSYKYKPCSLEKKPKCQEQLEVLSDPAMGARRHSNHKEGVDVFDVTTLASDDDIKEICNLLLRSCQS